MKKHLIPGFIGSLAVPMLLLILISSTSAQVAVSDIQAAIKASGANWVAGESRITKLSPEEQKRLLGVKNEPKQNTHPPTGQSRPIAFPPLSTGGTTGEIM